MKFFHKFLAVSFAIMSISACSFKDFDEVGYPRQPQGYLALLNAYESGKSFVEINTGAKYTDILFSDGSKVNFPNSEISFADRRQKGVPKTIKYFDDIRRWYVDGKQTPVSDNTKFTDSHSVPVYACYDWNTIHLYLSNGNEIHFPYVENPFGPTRVFTMPKVYLVHHADRIHHDSYRDGTFAIYDPDNRYSAVDSILCKTQIKGRGNTSWGMPKQPYHIKLESKQSLLGMPANKDWVFINNYSDKSLVRNMLAMQLSRIVGMTWTPRCMNVELYLNGEYRGVYCLSEHKEVAKDKVNINTVKPEDKDISGDYYLEIESNTDEPAYFSSSLGVPFQFKAPKNPTEEQFEYVRNYVNKFESTLKDYKIRGTDEGYRKYIDVDSFVNYFIVEELAKDVDGTIFKSNFLTIEKGKKLKFYHLWDFDITFGNCDYISGDKGPEGWYIKTGRWYKDLFLDKGFKDAVKAKWEEVYPELLRMPDYIDKCAAEMGDAPKRNFQKWDILGKYVWPNVALPETYGGEVDYLKDFYAKRLQWMNNEIAKW